MAGGKASKRGEARGVTQQAPPETVELAKRVVEAAADKLASDVVLMDTRQVCSFVDYFVICSGESERQMEAIHDAIIQVLKYEAGVPYHREGDATSGWVLIDTGSVIIHVFAPFEREYYQLEKLWGKAPVVVKII